MSDSVNVYELGYSEPFLRIKVQRGPIKENGVNGIQVDALIEHAKACLDDFNRRMPCRENSLAITKLDEALMWLQRRTENREARGVEGTSKA